MEHSLQNLIVFAKRPILGKVKSRLAKDIGDERALDIYNKLLIYTKDIVAQWKALDNSIVRNVHWFWDIPNEEEGNPVEIPDSFEVYIQGKGDLGEKMSLAFEEIFSQTPYFGFSQNKPFPVAIIGTDCPDISATILQECFVQLADSDISIGPAIDGGYYLLGMRQFHPEVFENVEWSSNRVLKQTIQNIKSKNLLYTELPVLKDIDRVDDLVGTKLA
ncbi:MAG: TIGR04282 family arsenosugar biosynthesis glycosyltransferase [Leptospira sp.]|nr:TIGR04282 family arsenosugar biosynthesis glycosyltransferase [Leptospira sp.]